MRGYDPGHDVAAAEAAAVQLTLVAGPFTRAERLRRFVQAVETLPDMREAAIVGLEQGMLSLALQYADALPLLERLWALTEFPFAVEQQDEDRLVLRLRDDTDGPAP